MCESLLHEGAEVVFGIPGGAVIPLYHSLADYPIHHVLMRHEQAAAHAADGYARASGRVGVCLSTSGPGATNLATGLATAYAAGSPVVALCGQAPLGVLGTDAFQEVDIVSTTEPVTKHNYLVTAPEELPRMIAEAFHVARSGQPGPVVIVVSSDVQRAQSKCLPPEKSLEPDHGPATLAKAPGSQAEAGPSGYRSHWGEDSDRSCQTLAQLVLDAAPGATIVTSEEIGVALLQGHHRPRYLIQPGPMGTKGFALAAAIGAQTALPSEEVWVLAQDDGLQATVQELATVRQEKLPVRIAVLNWGHSAAGGRERHPLARKACFGWGQLGPEWVRLAGAYGIPGLTARDKREARSAIARAHASPEAFFIDYQLA